MVLAFLLLTSPSSDAMSTPRAVREVFMLLHFLARTGVSSLPRHHPASTHPLLPHHPPLVHSTPITSAGLFTHKSSIHSLRSRLRVCDLPRLVILDEFLVLSLPLRLRRSFLTPRRNSASLESTASCSREARLPLRHCRLDNCRDLHHSFLGAVVSNLHQDHVVVIVPQ